MNFKVDLHTHSIASADGGISAAQYHRAFDTRILDCAAITDHNCIDFATQMKAELGGRIIVGEEIMTTAGEIIGLFLEEAIPAGLTALETARKIKQQGALVYIPHPFETVRRGLHPAVLEELADLIDIVEICNGRAFFQNRSEQAVVWTKLNHKLGAAASDAHGFKGIGKTFVSMNEIPTRENLLELLKSAIPLTERPGMRALLYPKYHRLRKRIRGNA